MVDGLSFGLLGLRFWNTGQSSGCLFTRRYIPKTLLPQNEKQQNSDAEFVASAVEKG
jgi:hypothetical protein